MNIDPKRGKPGPKARPASDRYHECYDVGPGCWEWTGGRNNCGYGVFYFGARGSKRELAHRMGLKLLGVDLAGKQVMHQCDNPACVRPSHLRVGDHLKNMAEMVSRGRSPWGERHGAHKLTADQVFTAREAHANGLSLSRIAEPLGVSPSTIHDAVTGRTWRHLSNEKSA